MKKRKNDNVLTSGLSKETTDRLEEKIYQEIIKPERTKDDAQKALINDVNKAIELLCKKYPRYDVLGALNIYCSGFISLLKSAGKRFPRKEAQHESDT